MTAEVRHPGAGATASVPATVDGHRASVPLQWLLAEPTESVADTAQHQHRPRSLVSETVALRLRHIQQMTKA